MFFLTRSVSRVACSLELDRERQQRRRTVTALEDEVSRLKKAAADVARALENEERGRAAAVRAMQDTRVQLQHAEGLVREKETEAGSLRSQIQVRGWGSRSRFLLPCQTG